METTMWQTYPLDEVIVVGIINTSNQNQINNFIEENRVSMDEFGQQLIDYQTKNYKEYEISYFKPKLTLFSKLIFQI